MVMASAESAQRILTALITCEKHLRETLLLVLCFLKAQRHVCVAVLTFI